MTRVPSRRRRNSRRHPPAFTPVKLRSRRGGWTPEIQCAFLAHLYLTGCVAAASRAVGRSRESAYRLRQREGAESFARAWDKVLDGRCAPVVDWVADRRGEDWRKVTLPTLRWRVEIGLWRPIIYRGKMRGIARKPDDTALLRLLTRLDARVAGIEEGAL
ncbi:hypothetical protein NAP1_15603 [Erythrobacter sp. NAP1]|uniref:hypothetical protein n=1 Tax=Erythrobacter sp. NAP1 TaxID=237727 RepID=UPI00006876D7|nr:hypothetical protein [Erythrobacter sp. NAP1]EAQ29038.1 hypothetical protein NAP1_15603 [Erythrobacter sp. NAP1]